MLMHEHGVTKKVRGSILTEELPDEFACHGSSVILLFWPSVCPIIDLMIPDLVIVVAIGMNDPRCRILKKCGIERCAEISL